jgi:hypothetical protein
MDYPVAERALIKWTKERLKLIEVSEKFCHYRFEMDGSTCSNGGVEFKAFLHANISPPPQSLIEKAWIEIPEEEQASAAHMCCCFKSGPKERQTYFESLKKDASFTGESLENEILKELPLNHAGCLCYQPMINQKWKMALSTIHYARSISPSGI